jgi:hypothetical protein
VLEIILTELTFSFCELEADDELLGELELVELVPDALVPLLLLLELSSVPVTSISWPAWRDSSLSLPSNV